MHPRVLHVIRALTAAVLMAALVMVPSGSATAEPADDSEGLARVVGTDLLGGELATVGTARSGNPSDAGPNQAPINATVLDDLLDVTLPGLAVPLIGDGSNNGLLDLGGAADAGLLDSYSSSPSDTSSTATSGAVGDDGAIDAGAIGDPSTIGTTRLDLTALLGQLGLDGVTDEVVDQLAVELGALASRASQGNAGAADRTYGLAGARLTVSSPAVADLAASVQRTVAGTESTLDAVAGPNGALGRALGGVNIDLPLLLADVEVGPATGVIDLNLDAVTNDLLSKPLVDDNGFVSIDLSKGTISVDLAKVVKNSATASDLNGLDPNTELLSADVIQRISDAVGGALGDIGNAVGSAVDRALDNARLTVKLPGSVTPLIGTASNLNVEIDGTLADFAGTSGQDPTIDIDTGGLGGSLLTTVLRALGPALADVVTTVVGPVARSTLDTVTDGLEPAVNGLTSSALTALAPLFDDVLPNVATITINEQTEDDASELTNEEGSSTVRALAIDVLPNLGDRALAEVNLASSTVRVGNADEEDGPTLNANPEIARAGDTVTTTSSGWPPNSRVDLTYTDSDGDVIATVPVTTSDAGTLTDTFVVPAGTPTGALTISGSDADGRTADDTVQILSTPTLDSGPQTLSPGDTLTTTGEGWPPNSDVVLTYRDADGAPVGDPKTVRSDAAGNISDTLTVPAGTPAGTLTISGTGDTGAEAVDTVQVENAPTLSSSPGEVRPGDTITTELTGFPPSTDVTVTYTDDSGDEIDTHTVTTDENGSATDTLVVPAGTPVGELTIAADDGDGATAEDTVTVVPPATAPTISAAPDEVQPGDTVTVNGGGFPPSTEVTVTYTDGAGDPIGQPHTVTTDEDGSFADTLDVPAGTPPGTLTVEADDGDGSTAEDTVTVVPAAAAPTLDVQQTEVAYGSPIDVVSDGWPPNSAVTVTYTDSAGDAIGTHTVLTDDDGRFTDSLTVPAGTALGDASVTATGGDGLTASDEVEVVANPVVTSGPAVVQPGDTVTSELTGFPPNAEVTVTYADSDGDPVGTSRTVTTDENGSVTETLVVPDGTKTGELTVRADAGSGIAATDTVTVAAADPDDPTVTVGPDPVNPGQTITVVGGGFPPSTSVEVTYTDANGDEIDTHTVTTGADGSVRDELVVPGGTPAGELEVTIDDGDGASATGTTTVEAADLDPTITASPGVVNPGDTITSDLNGFPPSAVVTLTYTDSDGNEIGRETVTTDRFGGFQDETFQVPAGTPGGAITIRGDDGNGNAATATVNVVVEDDDPAITAGPPTVAPGDTVTVDGTGFPPNTDVTITPTDSDGDELGETVVRTDDDGDLTDTFVVPPGTATGPLTIVAEAANGESSTVAIRVVAAGEGVAGVDEDADGLPDTGSPFGIGLVLLAVLLVIAGTVAVVRSRRAADEE